MKKLKKSAAPAGNRTRTSRVAVGHAPPRSRFFGIVDVVEQGHKHFQIFKISWLKHGNTTSLCSLHSAPYCRGWTKLGNFPKKIRILI